MLTFKPITADDIPLLLSFAKYIPARSCDYTTGNLVMWARFMDYRFAIHDDTLFISCKSESDLKSHAFMPPIGKMPLDKSIEILQAHCQAGYIPLRLTAVPATLMQDVSALLPLHSCTPLDGWSDYIYSAQSLATLQGKALNKKRNRYNKFIAETPMHTYRRCTLDDIPQIIRFLAADRDCQHGREDNMRCYEQWQCMATVRNLTLYNQPAALITAEDRVIAFTLGELFGDTLYIHIEKASREHPGATEAINRYFANDMLADNPALEYINREEDLGDPGLRQAKMAYNPIELLHRYEFTPQ